MKKIKSLNRDTKAAKKTLKPKRKAVAKKLLHHRVRRFLKRGSKGSKGVVYFSHVPHGFYEKEMRQFFSQFGEVSNINIPRSQRTGKYRGYAFVEFLYSEVAKIVAETMNNYLMFKKILKAKYIPPAEQKPICFRFKKYKIPLLIQRRRILRRRSNRKLNSDECKKDKDRLEKNLAKKLNKLKKLGMSYDFQVC